MEAKLKISLSHRLLALVTAALLLLSLLPSGAIRAWAEGPYTVSVVKTGEGVVKVNGEETESVSVAENAAVALEASPAEGWELSSVRIGGTEQTVSDPAGWSGSVVVTGDLNVEVTFTKAPVQHNVTVTKTGEGTVLLDGAELNTAAVSEGASVNVKVTPAAKYGISEIKYNGEAQSVADPAAFEDDPVIHGDLAIDVVFVKTVPEHSVKVTKTGKGSVTINGTEADTVSVDEGDPAAIQILPSAGYCIQSVKIDGAELPLTEGEKAGCTKTVTVNADMNVAVQFTTISYTLTTGALSNGSVTLKRNGHNAPGSSVSFTVEDTVGFEVKPANGYSVSEVQVNGKDPAELGATVAVNGTTIVFSFPAGIAQDLTVTASFQANNVSWDDVIFTGGYFTPPYAEGSNRLIYVYPNTVGAVEFSPDWPAAYPTFYANGVMLNNNELTESTKVQSLKYDYGILLRGTASVSLPASQVYFILDRSAPVIEGTQAYEPDAEGNVPCFDSNLEIPLTVYDPDWETGNGKQTEYDNHTYSGILSLSYELRVSDDPTSFTDAPYRTGTVLTGSSTSAQKTGSGTLQISFDDQVNDKYVQVTLTAKDRAGNSKTVSFVISFSNEVPVFVSYVYPDTETYTTPYGGQPYFGSGRTATIVIQEGKKSFNPSGVSLVGTVQDIYGNSIDEPFTIDKWKDSKDESGKLIHTATVRLKDGRYQLTAVQYRNRTNKTVQLDLSGREAKERQFVVDTVLPTGKLNASCASDTYWESLIDDLTFGIWANKDVTIYLYANDQTSEILKTSYYLSPETTAMTVASLNALPESEWTVFTGGSFTVPASKRFAAYVRVTDAAGHSVYVSTNGIIADRDRPVVEMKPSAGFEGGTIYGIANDAKVDVTVTEPEGGSGLKSIRWWVEYWDGSEWKQSDEKTVLNQEYHTAPHYEELILEKSFTIDVKEAENNWSKVRVSVEAVDNAGNGLAPEAEPVTVELDIDVTAPVISIEYERTQAEGADPDCYNSVVALVKITERTDHFDETAATNGIVIEATDAKGDPITEGWLYHINSWITEEGASPDEAVHTARIAFLEDGNYKLTVNYTDKAGNPAAERSDSFALDATPPTGTVTVNGKGTWSALKEILSFGLWSADELEVTATAEDSISSVVYADYYKTDAVEALSAGELKALPAAEWKPFNLSGSLKVPADERFTVYLRLRDKSGNVCYLSTDGVVVDAQKSSLTLTPSAPAQNGIYNAASTVKLGIEAKDGEPYSGIRLVEYWVMCDGVETAREKLYEYVYTRDPGDDANGGSLQIFEYGKEIYNETGCHPTQAELTGSWTGEVEIDKAANNSCNVEVFVCVVDNAGNSETQSVKLDIDATAPETYIYYDNNEPYKTVGERGYYPKERTATIVIVERDHHFSAEDATDGIVITAKDAKGNVVLSDAEIKAMIGSWEFKPSDSNPDEDRHIAEIKYSADANYSFEMSYTDQAGNSGFVTAAGQTTPWQFTVDQTAPTASIEAKGINTWDKLVETLSFGIFSKVKVDYSGSWDDVTSPIESVSYYKTNSNSALKASALDAVSDWKPFSGLSVSPNERVTVYLRVVDYAGNVYYVSTDGIIIDDRDPAVQSVTPRVTVSPAQPVNGIYNSDVPIRVQVEDPVVNGSYAGLKEIRYEVRNMGAVTLSGTLYSYSGTAHSQSDLKQSWENSSAIVVDRNKNNSNEVEITVYAVDNAGNEGKGSAEIKIDVTPPVISVSYDNNNGDNALADANSGAYFNAPRTATIVVTERNFDPAAVQLTLTNAYGTTPGLSAWRTEGGGGNGDSTRHIATLSFAEDGNYNVDLACSDQAGNRSDGVTWNGMSPQRFTVDRTAPVIRVDYAPDDAAAQNGSFFNGPRTATITINERNFESSRIEITLTGRDHGQAITLPAVEGWTTSGDSHVATISYTVDGAYGFDISYRDKAGNAAADYPADSFTIDQTPPAVEIKGVADESANSDKGKIGFTLSATDTNFDLFEPEISASFYRDGAFVTETLELGEIRDIADGKELVVDNLPEDGIYFIKCRVVDLAGNAFEEITLYDQSGKAYTEQRTAEDLLMSFSVNRKGSSYAIDDATQQLVDQYYVQHVPGDVVLVEVNTDETSEYSVSLNGRELVEGTDYTVTREGGKGEWFKCTYRVNAALFEEEGSYNVVVSSTDRAGNATFSDVKGVGVKFVVDRTAPVVTVSGMESDGRYQTDRQTVTLIPTDDGGALQSLLVLLVDEEGNTIRELVNLKGEDFEKALEQNDGKISFDLEEDLYQNVRIICDDWAYYGDEENVIHDETFTNVSVSTSALKIFWANKPLRWGSIGGVGGLGAAGILFLLLKKRKKEEAEVEEAGKNGKKSDKK